MLEKIIRQLNLIKTNVDGLYFEYIYTKAHEFNSYFFSIENKVVHFVFRDFNDKLLAEEIYRSRNKVVSFSQKKINYLHFNFGNFNKIGLVGHQYVSANQFDLNLRKNIFWLFVFNKLECPKDNLSPSEFTDLNRYYAHFIDIGRTIEPIFIIKWKNKQGDWSTGKGYSFGKWKMAENFTTDVWGKDDYIEIKHLDFLIHVNFIDKGLVSVYVNKVCFSEKVAFDINSIGKLISKQLGFKLPKLKVGW